MGSEQIPRKFRADVYDSAKKIQRDTRVRIFRWWLEGMGCALFAAWVWYAFVAGSR